MNDLSQSIIALIEHHNQPTALGWFRKVDRAGFHLQQLPLSEVDFAILMSDFFITFGVCSEQYDDARYFPEPRRRRFAVANWFTAGTAQPYRPLTVAMLYEAARLGRWPEEAY
ncbi:DUF1493 family protein [Pantoea agglomerans]|jgi:hypothetical protein|uniref:DUF1493 family protein n=1 Tax=Enterobacter agglomerans TaxID=549 RepID=A0A7X2SWK5_ENTAG|nr:DUF1493 family protein [Pantoea agglomerans]MBD8259958.1 DUF1493 family protein [Pantoea agglomerans]MSE16159.1 DUF1493 family protein [Pantoea agglomerans]UJQ22700.1 DUF1493 family protein [Pantoea agglomerans]